MPTRLPYTSCITTSAALTNRVGMVLRLLGERVGQAGEPAHPHPHGQVLAFDVRRSNLCHVRLTEDRFLNGPGAFCGRILALVAFGSCRVAILFDQHGVIHITGEGIRDSLEVSTMPISGQLDASCPPPEGGGSGRGFWCQACSYKFYSDRNA